MPPTAATEIACLSCGKAAAPWLTVPGDWRRPQETAEYSLYWCDACAFGQVAPRPSRDEIPKFYQVGSYYTHGNGSAHDAESPPGLGERIRIKIAWLSDHGHDLDGQWLRAKLGPQARICDLGCGNGDLLKAASERGYAATGVEPDPDARRFAQQRGLTVLPGTAEDLPAELRDSRFDCVVMSHVLEHCLDPKQAVAGAAGLLAERGLLVIETPNNEARGLDHAGVLWPWLDVPRHLNFFTAKALQAVCENAGLHVRQIEYRGYTRQFDRDWIATEQTIRGVFAARRNHLPSANRKLSAWKLLFSTLGSPDRLKYDSVRLIAARK